MAMSSATSPSPARHFIHSSIWAGEVAGPWSSGASQGGAGSRWPSATLGRPRQWSMVLPLALFQAVLATATIARRSGTAEPWSPMPAVAPAGSEVVLWRQAPGGSGRELGDGLQQEITKNSQKQPRSGWAEVRATNEAAEGPGATRATDGQQKITENNEKQSKTAKEWLGRGQSDR